MKQLGQAEKQSSSGGRKRFTSEETDTIKCFFSDYIASKNVPSAEECRQFLSQHRLGKNAKQVRDEVHILIGR